MSDEREKLRKEAEARAKKYGISFKEGKGHLTPPKDYPDNPDQYGDPVNYAYPIDEAHIKPAVSYFNHEGQREAGGYTPEEWAVIGKRIAAAASRLLGGKYEYKDGKVVRVDDEGKKLAEQGLLKIPFFRLGTWRHPVYGEIKADRQLFAQMVKNFKDGVLGRPVFVRLGHDAANKATFGDAPAEAWVKDIVEENGVLYAIAEPTSPEVLEMVRTGRYRFASAEYTPNFVDKETGEHKGPVLTAIALTNEPFLTRLPEARVLSDPPDTIYLDYAEVDNEVETKELLQENNSLLRQLAEQIGKLFGGKKEEKSMQEEVRVNLSEFEDMKRKLAETEVRLRAAEEQNRKAEVERRLSELVAKGIPPVMCNKAKEILLAMPADETIKLAEDKSAKLSDLIFDLLDSMPESSRIKFAQLGAQESVKPGSAAEIYGDVVPSLKKGAEK